VLEILKYPDPRLSIISKPVTVFDKALGKLLDDMADAMYLADGVGLAAPQVGKPLRAFIIDLGTEEEEDKELFEFVNPHLTNGSGKILFEEGCLSVPGIAEEVQRHERISVEFQDRRGKSHKMDAEGLLAVALQHENDHLDGVLFIERLSTIKKHLIKRKLSKVVTL
jgi:peptide deformylase